MTGEAAAAPKEEEEAKAVAGVVEAASAEEAEAMSIEEATARHVIQCLTLVFPPPRGKKESRIFLGGNPDCPPASDKSHSHHTQTNNPSLCSPPPRLSPSSSLSAGPACASIESLNPLI